MSEREARDIVVRLDGQAVLDRIDARWRFEAFKRRIEFESELTAKGERWDGEKIVPL